MERGLELAKAENVVRCVNKKSISRKNEILPTSEIVNVLYRTASDSIANAWHLCLLKVCKMYFSVPKCSRLAFTSAIRETSSVVDGGH